MANPEHLEILKRSVEEWNQWRWDDPEIQPDLKQADLGGASLTKANLSGANLRWANLSEANLSWANLSWANLVGANFSRAKLSVANLIRANLREADLSWADLSWADLSMADLSGANLSGAVLYEAVVINTTFGNNDLSLVKRLDTVEHSGPSTIGIDTLYNSGGNIPEVFLRGCGVPETFITFAKSLVGKPLEFYSCFISYSHADKSFARRLHDQLQARGICSAHRSIH